MSMTIRCISAENFCCMLASWFPRVSCFALIIWAGYSLCVSLLLERLGGAIGWILAVLYLGLVVLCLFTYSLIVRAGGGSPLDFPELKIQNIDVLDSCNANGIKVSSAGTGTNTEYRDEEVPQPPESLIVKTHTIKNNGQYRYCSKCSVWKPDRTHHCSTCHVCVLKMDHHCPWFATCIGFRNQKYFVQFLIYSELLSTSCFISTSYVLWGFFFSESFLNEYLSVNLVILFVISLSVTLSLGVFVGFSMYLVFKNKTTIEFQEANRYKSNEFQFSQALSSDKLGNIFDVGSRQNWSIVMGNSWFQWIFPVEVRQRGNGLNFDINQDIHAKLEYNAQLQTQLNQRLHDFNRNTDIINDAGYELV